ncbi:EamA family transporter [Nocardia rhamnosiphila]|uniref:EamA family transporter n=1 Tax=Nocardia rhamnosiphila TaxID=426716 RepID=A0ABV2WYG3_9NOCA
MTAGAALALASAAAYGVSDFTGGLLARRIDLRVVAIVGQFGGLVVALAAAALFPGQWDSQSMLWGALSGLGTGVGMLFLFRGLSRGAMSTVVPVSAVGGVALPVLAGVLWLGERPAVAAWAGVAVTVPALWLVSHGGAGGRAAGTGDALIAGAGIAVQYLALAQSDPAAGIWPVVAGRVAAVLTLLPLLRGTGERPRPAAVVWSLATGAAAAIALICYLLAGREQLVVIAVVLSSLYPVIPVVLGLVVLGEKLTRIRTTGLVAALLAVALLVFD